MISTLKSEFKKLFTVRSTYFISIIALLLLAFLSLYVEGIRNSGGLSPGSSINNLFMAGTITQHANVISIFGALIALLLMAHEYRYNTIEYTLTASNNRSKVLTSKMVAIMVFILGFSVILTIVGFLLARVGVAISGHAMPAQDINYLTYTAKVVFTCEGYALVGFLLAILIRNLVGAIAVLFIAPNTVEGLLSLILKHNSVYMPFTALAQVAQAPVLSGARSVAREAATGHLTPPRGALIFLAYLVFAWIIAWYLFLHRDAS